MTTTTKAAAAAIPLNYTIVPSLLAADLGNLEKELKSVEQLGGTIIHLDIMDGRFVPPITFGAAVVSLVKRVSNLYREVHLMVEDAETHFTPFIEAGAERIIFHIEGHPHAHRMLTALREKGVSPGISLTPATPVAAVAEVLELCDVVLVMSVNPGWGGQPFIPAAIQRIAQLHELITAHNHSTVIEVDGGINFDTAPKCVAAGASLLVAGTAWFKSQDRRAAFAMGG